ncbi:PAC2 family-domain-containing protein [Fimicolochytrium jonesii]|uniref:PAC2 family-domain-containing protein n=1 Tax=Fimicolochytrium jonesii TaxID=1396493 RepID=UPI0022FF4368|nr:PAC2 family-domain-containing protein [Fimicolochytrium jonesii]KAI8820647.1 PAC2 family-domain-containing protein [Fimicolochytrium jonesii]
MTAPALIEFQPVPSFAERSLRGTMLVIPAPNALGNLGQLAVDALISTLKLQRIGFIDTPFIAPVCGIDSYGEHEGEGVLHTTVEVYAPASDSELHLTVVQIRSPVQPRKAVAFAKHLKTWITEVGFSDVVLVTGADAGRRDDSQMATEPLRVLPTASSPSRLLDRATELGITVLGTDEMKRAWVTKPSPVPPGAGVSRFVFDEFSTQESGNEIPLLIALWFANDGDPTQALQLASAVFRIISSKDTPPVEEWKVPASWSFLYGSQRFTKELFQ